MRWSTRGAEEYKQKLFYLKHAAAATREENYRQTVIYWNNNTVNHLIPRRHPTTSIGMTFLDDKGVRTDFRSIADVAASIEVG